MNDVTVNEHVNVLSEHVQKKPVAHFRAAHNDLHRFPFDEAETHSQQVDAQPRWEDDQCPIDDSNGGKNGEYQEPEPEEDVDLLVDHVQGQDTDGIMSLYFATHSIFVECALGHPREDVGERVYAILIVGRVQEHDDVQAKTQELAFEEQVHEEYLPNNVDKGEHLADVVPIRPPIVITEMREWVMNGLLAELKRVEGTLYLLQVIPQVLE